MTDAEKTKQGHFPRPQVSFPNESEPASALTRAVKALSVAAHVLEVAGYKRAEGLARLKEVVTAGDMNGAEKAADALSVFMNEYVKAEAGFLAALNACRHAWETRGEQ